MIWYFLGSGRKAKRRQTVGRRAAMWLPALLLAASCVAPVEPGAQLAAAARRAPTAAPNRAAAPRLGENSLIAADGAVLPLRKWLPKGRPKAVILGLHGFNDYSHAFAMPARLWAERGIATYAYDQRGFGGAPLRRGWAGDAQLAADAVTAMRLLRRAYPGLPVYLLGESMGGAVAVLASTGIDSVPPAEADGVILGAPAVWGRGSMDLLPRLALFAAVRFFPGLELTGRGLDIKPTDNIAVLKELAKDPIVIKGAWVTTVYGLVDLMDDAVAAAPRLAAPLLLMYGAHDEIVPRDAVARFVEALPAAAASRHRLAYYPNGYHMLLRDLDGATVAGDVANWVLSPQAPLPSQADRIEAQRPWPPVKDRTR